MSRAAFSDDERGKKRVDADVHPSDAHVVQSPQSVLQLGVVQHVPQLA